MPPNGKLLYAITYATQLNPLLSPPIAGKRPLEH